MGERPLTGTEMSNKSEELFRFSPAELSTKLMQTPPIAAIGTDVTSMTLHL